MHPEQRTRRTNAPPAPSHEQLTLLVEAVRDHAIFGLDDDGNITSWNPGAERINGWRAEEIVGRHFSTFYPPEDVVAGKPQRELETALQHGTYEEEGWRLRKDGSRFMAHVIITALKDEHGRPYGFAKITRDVTNRYRTEQALREKLEELACLNGDLEHHNAEQEHFIHAISHDLRAPLLSVSGMTEMLIEALEEEDLGEARLLAKRLQVNVDRTQRLLNDLLAFLRAGRGSRWPAGGRRARR
ncbi:MAG TPA: PAS domain S-box protein [Deinococcales bacterium]|nr:PAS domain S-box protein [Deinococcales bacterium]